MYDHDEVQEVLALYLMGDLSAAEADAVGAHLEGCEFCSKELARSAEVLELTEELGRLSLSMEGERAKRARYWPFVIKAAGLILAFVLGLKAGEFGPDSAPRMEADEEVRDFDAKSDAADLERLWIETSGEAKTPLARLIVASRKLD